jgi:hypothetical protein
MRAENLAVSWWQEFFNTVVPQRAPAPWWKHFPQTESRQYRGPSANDRPALRAGDSVRLKLRQEKTRRVLKVEWHSHRHEYVYVIKTSAAPRFEPYWFLGQLEV